MVPIGAQVPRLPGSIRRWRILLLVPLRNGAALEFTAIGSFWSHRLGTQATIV